MNLGNYSYGKTKHGLPGRLERRSKIILRHAQIPVQGQCFGISQTTKPNTWQPTEVCAYS